MSKNFFFHHLTSKDKRPKSKVFFDNRLSKTTSPRDNEFFMVESLRTKDKSPFFLRLRVYKTTGLRVFSFELELRIHGTASIGKSLTSKVKRLPPLTVVCCPLSVVLQSKQPATALLVVLLTRSLVVLKTTGYHPKVRCLLSVVRCPATPKPTTDQKSVVCCPLSFQNKSVFARVSER